MDFICKFLAFLMFCAAIDDSSKFKDPLFVLAMIGLIFI